MQTGFLIKANEVEFLSPRNKEKPAEEKTPEITGYDPAQTRKVAQDHGFEPVVPPKKNRLKPWEYDKELYKRRNEIERYFLRIQRFRRVFTRYEKLDTLFLGVICFAMIADALM